MKPSTIVWLAVSIISKAAAIFAVSDPKLTQALHDLGDLILVVAAINHIKPAAPAAGGSAGSGSQGSNLWATIWQWIVSTFTDQVGPGGQLSPRILPKPAIPAAAIAKEPPAADPGGSAPGV